MGFFVEGMPPYSAIHQNSLSFPCGDVFRASSCMLQRSTKHFLARFLGGKTCGFQDGGADLPNPLAHSSTFMQIVMDL